MSRSLLLTACLLVIGSPVGAAEPSFDEYAESPTMCLACGEFPAIRLVVNGVEAESRGFICRGHTYLPVREALEKAGGIVSWVDSRHVLYASFPGRQRTISLMANSQVVNIYRYDPEAPNEAGKPIGSVRLDAMPIHCEGRLFAPVRKAIEAVGGSLSYDHARKMLSITTPQKSATGDAQ